MSSGPSPHAKSRVRNDRVSSLARERDWPGLWRFAFGLPLAEAVAAVAQIDRAWRPEDEAGRDLMARLAAVRPRKIRAATAPPRQIDMSLLWFKPGNSCVFAPDGGAVAVLQQVNEYGILPNVTYRKLPEGRLKRGFRVYDRSVALFDGGMVFSVFGKSWRETLWFRYLPGHGTESLAQVDERVSSKAIAVRGGFLIAEPARLIHGTAEPGSPLLDVTPPRLQLDGDGDHFQHVVEDPVTGRLAVHVVRRGPVLSDDVLILEPDYSVAGQVSIPFDTRWRGAGVAGFGAPDRLITVQTRSVDAYARKLVQAWPIGQLVAAEAEVELKSPVDLVVRPYGRVIMNDRNYLDPRTLRPAECPPALAWELAWARDFKGGVRVSSKGSRAAISRSWVAQEEKVYYSLHVIDFLQQQLSEWAKRPMADFSASDLASVQVLCERMRARPTEGAVALLRDCLDYRASLISAPGTPDVRLARIWHDDRRHQAGRARHSYRSHLPRVRRCSRFIASAWHPARRLLPDKNEIDRACLNARPISPARCASSRQVVW